MHRRFTQWGVETDTGWDKLKMQQGGKAEENLSPSVSQPDRPRSTTKAPEGSRGACYCSTFV